MLIYLAVMFKPIIPFISDIYSHAFGEAIHLATIHARYGNNHLEKALATTGKSNNKDQKNCNSGEINTVHISSPECIFDFRLNTSKLTFFFRRFYKLSTIFLSILVPPPDR